MVLQVEGLGWGQAVWVLADVGPVSVVALGQVFLLLICALEWISPAGCLGISFQARVAAYFFLFKCFWWRKLGPYATERVHCLSEKGTRHVSLEREMDKL